MKESSRITNRALNRTELNSPIFSLDIYCGLKRRLLKGRCAILILTIWELWFGSKSCQAPSALKTIFGTKFRWQPELFLQQ